MRAIAAYHNGKTDLALARPRRTNAKSVFFPFDLNAARLSLSEKPLRDVNDVAVFEIKRLRRLTVQG